MWYFFLFILFTNKLQFDDLHMISVIYSFSLLAEALSGMICSLKLRLELFSRSIGVNCSYIF